MVDCLKKILIVNNNMQIGGIQKSLLNLLNNINNDYDITLLLFSDYGILFKEIPKNVKVIFADKRTQVLGTPWSDIKKNPLLVYYKLFSKILCKVKGKDAALSFLFKHQKTIMGYDAVISYSHCTSEHALSVCTPEFVLKCTKSKNKICFIHCDYIHSDTFSEHNNQIYKKFSKIACCSEAVRNNFLQKIPDLQNRTFTVRNFYDLSIVDKAKNDTYFYDDKYINLISVSRLSKEKGILRAIKALCDCKRKDIRYYVVGTGPQEKMIQEYISSHNMSKNIILLGEQENPYRFMINADYLLVPSYHEAAPMVFDEANILNVPVISSNTTSANEMLTQFDIISDNIDEQLFKCIKKKSSKKFTPDLSKFKQSFVSII